MCAIAGILCISGDRTAISNALVGTLDSMTHCNCHGYGK